jgi:hypothetical protein
MAERHADWEELIEIAIGGNDAPTNQHVSECATCREQLLIAREVVTSLFAAGVDEPGIGTINRAVRAVTAEAAEARGASLADHVRSAVESLRDALVAGLVADSWTPSVAVRGATTAWPRVLVYETADHSISLSMTPGEIERSTSIVGQVVPRGSEVLPDPRRATLLGDGGERVTDLTEFGEFTFADALGATRLEILLGEQPICIDPLPDGHDAPERI